MNCEDELLGAIHIPFCRLVGDTVYIFSYYDSKVSNLTGSQKRNS